MKQKAVIIGSGFAGLSTACHLAKNGLETTILEKNEMTGGRARSFSTQGFTFDMGPSWYWMPDVFEDFFQHFGKSSSDYYNLVELSPQYRIFYGKDDFLDIPSKEEDLYDLFESVEKGSGKQLQKFLKEAAYKYEVGIQDLVYKPGDSLLEFADWRVIKSVFKLHLFRSFKNHVQTFFKHPKLVNLMEFPVLFLGALPENTPALYSLMNYAGLSLGTWYPMGGMRKIIDGMTDLAIELGVEIKAGHEVNQLNLNGVKVKNAEAAGKQFSADYFVAGADYNFVEQNLLPPKHRRYDEKYWDSRVMAPSSLIFYLGVDKKVKNLLHHNLFFDEDFSVHAKEIYENPQWPSKPLFYVCCPSKTDPSVAPEGKENIFILMPLAVGIEDTEAHREKFYQLIMQR